MTPEKKIVATNGNVLVLNPNEGLVEKILKRVEIRNGYCPCRVEENADTVCPCLDARENGHCCCKLYLPE